jgi:hypothetical protein
MLHLPFTYSMLYHITPGSVYFVGVWLRGAEVGHNLLVGNILEKSRDSADLV